MRLPDRASKAVLILSLGGLLAGCGSVFGGSDVRIADAAATTGASAYGPEADYPQVLGEPFTVDGELYTPEDVYSYDAVGLASLDVEGGAGVSIAHKTLPVPSYVEVTSLESGKTIVARIERRGPMTSQRLVALSPGAAAQLGIAEGASVRVRRTNPPEAERAELRAGRSVAERLATPESLLAVLRKKLPVAGGSASLAPVASPAPTMAMAPTVKASVAKPALPAAVAAKSTTAPAAAPASSAPSAAMTSVDQTVPQAPRANKSYPLPAIASSAVAITPRGPSSVLAAGATRARRRPAAAAGRPAAA